MKSFLLTALSVVAISFATPALAAKLSDGEIVKLQAEMQMHIDAVSVEGALLGFDAATGKVLSYVPTKAHPKIMAMGEHIIMCADVVDASGKTAMVNFYMAKNGGRYVVFHTTFGDDPALMRMMQSGQIMMAN